jgi:superfamily II DNA or RNA helicase
MGRVLVLAHRDELITQAVEKMALWIPRHLIGVVKAGAERRDVARGRGERPDARNERRLAQVGRFGLIVIDEAHHAAAASYREPSSPSSARSG